MISNFPLFSSSTDFSVWRLFLQPFKGYCLTYLSHFPRFLPSYFMLLFTVCLKLFALFLLCSQVNSPNGKDILQSMFPLSCARVHAHTDHETSAHKETWSAHKCSFQKCFAHISYMSSQIQMSSGKVLHNRNFMRRLKKIRGHIACNTCF